MRKLLLIGAAAITMVGVGAATAAGQTPRNEAFRMLALFGDVLGMARGDQTPAGVEVASVHSDTSAPRKVHNPQHPDADENGDIFLPNIDMVTEMTDLVGANRAYEASVTVLNASS